MYPVVRLAKELVKFRNRPKLGVTETHVSHHICWPWDIDPWLELNNGRTLTLFDLGRIPLSVRAGLRDVLRQTGWGIAVAGNTTRYRRRVRSFQRFEMRSRCIGWDNRFLYMEQAMWRQGECLNHMLVRVAVTGPKGIVPPAAVLTKMGLLPEGPELPQWVQDWIAVEARRPWPPEI